MQLSNHGRAGRVLMPVDTRNSSVMFIIRKDLKDQGIDTLESVRGLEAAGRPQADRLGIVARRHQPCVGLLLHGDR